MFDSWLCVNPFPRPKIDVIFDLWFGSHVGLGPFCHTNLRIYHCRDILNFIIFYLVNIHTHMYFWFRQRTRLCDSIPLIYKFIYLCLHQITYTYVFTDFCQFICCWMFIFPSICMLLSVYIWICMFMSLYSSQYNCLYVHVSSIFVYVLIYMLSFLYAKTDKHTHALTYRYMYMQYICCWVFIFPSICMLLSVYIRIWMFMCMYVYIYG